MIIFLSCQTTHVTNPESFRGKQVIIAEGGGFSGNTTQHIILDNGQVFVRTILPETLEESVPLERKAVREIFKRVEQLNISQISFNHPGNMTFSLVYLTETGKVEIKWGDVSYPAPFPVLESYQFIRAQIKQNN